MSKGRELPERQLDPFQSSDFRFQNLDKWRGVADGVRRR
jgi:hypothetical protein